MCWCESVLVFVLSGLGSDKRQGVLCSGYAVSDDRTAGFKHSTEL